MNNCVIYADKVIKKLGIEPNGKAQAILDASVISHLRKNMPYDSGTMSANTRRKSAGTIVVASPYAHYMNEGIKYVMPHNDKSAYYNPAYGFWSEPGKKKVASSEPLNYHGGSSRGAHFVERTLNEDSKDIVREVKRGVRQ